MPNDHPLLPLSIAVGWARALDIPLVPDVRPFFDKRGSHSPWSIDDNHAIGSPEPILTVLSDLFSRVPD